MATFTDIPFGSTSCLPITLIDETIGVKALVDYDEEIKQFVLDLNGEPFEGLIYLNPNFDPENKEVRTIQANLYINDKKIFGIDKDEDAGTQDAGTQEWQVSAVQGAIYEQIAENERITSIRVEGVQNTTADVLNELIGLLAVQDNIPAGGL